MLIRFRDPKFVGSTNYELVMRFLEERRVEQQSTHAPGRLL
jgi:hypothetical protein